MHRHPWITTQLVMCTVQVLGYENQGNSYFVVYWWHRLILSPVWTWGRWSCISVLPVNNACCYLDIVLRAVIIMVGVVFLDVPCLVHVTSFQNYLIKIDLIHFYNSWPTNAVPHVEIKLGSAHHMHDPRAGYVASVPGIRMSHRPCSYPLSMIERSEGRRTECCWKLIQTLKHLYVRPHSSGF